MKIDQMDLKILEVLTQDPRISMRELAKKVNLSAPSVAERVRNMEYSGVIEGYTTKINYKKLGFTIEAIINITVKNGNYERFKKHIKNYVMVDFCYRISGQSCYMVKIVVRSLEEIEEFIDSISELAHTVTYVVFSEVNTIPKFLEVLSE
ncbi:Lrp/AsnC family transcriptional regulator [Bacillus cereus group sp. N21]|uniref:Lrp/AsnC family transcriptional regulator n=1 Tax=Bacillus cereus group sp. N21 TaxID=2794591 RepID=UPI0018F69C67|nr:Lrp/AsnC family transcriptional regulator [Bacillus cereus group sp. N21]MBJ8031284.1 Lrp/AsnC family transcriptional regulator [Bacillus cereus group sp. N21]